MGGTSKFAYSPGESCSGLLDGDQGDDVTGVGDTLLGPEATRLDCFRLVVF